MIIDKKASKISKFYVLEIIFFSLQFFGTASVYLG